MPLHLPRRRRRVTSPHILSAKLCQDTFRPLHRKRHSRGNSPRIQRRLPGNLRPRGSGGEAIRIPGDIRVEHHPQVVHRLHIH